MKELLRFIQLLALPALLISCASEVATTPSSTTRFAEAPPDRPGLGTKWGETRRSSTSVIPFQRADPKHPLAVSALYYNDEAGVRAMVHAVAWQRSWPILSPLENLVSVGLKNPIGFFYPGVMIGDRWFVIGEEGRRYSIAVQNHTDARLEIVLSVDGLDVLDGRPASVRKRGYILGPHARLAVDGFRQSTESVAAFRFSPVRESYAAERYGRTRNVGVIGIAVFNERGTNFPTGVEVQKRLRANPFPGGFAMPPRQ